MIHEQMKKDNMEALKNKDNIKRQVLTLILGKLNLNAKENHIPFVEDSVTSTTINKTIKELTEEKEMFLSGNRLDHAEMLQKQIEILNSYLPKQLSEEEIRKIIDSLPDKNVPIVMKHFKTNYAGLVDMGLVNKILRTL